MKLFGIVMIALAACQGLAACLLDVPKDFDSSYVSPKLVLDKPSGTTAYYRLTFDAKSPVDGYWWVDFYDREDALLPDVNSRLYASGGFIPYDVVVPACPEAVTAVVKFSLKKPNVAQVRDLKMRRISVDEAAAWCARTYAAGPQLVPFETAGSWERLPKTRKALTGGKRRFDVVLLGDSLMNDSYCGLLGVQMQKAFPDVDLRVHISVRGSTGCWYYHEKEHFEECVAKYRPDLVLIGGISNCQTNRFERYRANRALVEEDFVETIERCKAIGAEVIVCTPPKSVEFRTSPEAKDLPADFNDESTAADYLQLAFERRAAARTGVQLWDLNGPTCRTVALSGKPLGWFNRDAVHNDDRGKQLIAQAFGAYFRAALADGFWLVLNEDNDHFFKNPTELMTEEALKAYVDDFARGHVTHFFMCPVGQRASYDSKVWEPIWAGMDEPGRKDSAQKPDGTHDIWCVNCKKLHDAGIDPYAVWTKRCREKGVSPWVTMRMNDVHFCNITNYFRNTTFCRTRRDLWLNPKTDFGEWAESQLNYAKKEVRDYNLAVVREMAERWDIDGLELDWMRFGYCLRPGHEAEDAHFVTEFVRDVRAALDEIGAKKGRRIALGTRVCYDPDISRELGMDVEEWARLGLLDVIVPHSFLSVDASIPVAKWKSRIGAVAPGVKIVPGIDSARERFPWKKFPHDLEVMRPSDYRGVAEIFRRGGADGVYLFNLPYNGKWPTDGVRHGDMATEVYERGLDPDETADLPRTYPPAYHDFPFAFRPAAPRQSDEIRAAIQPFIDRGEIAGIVSILSDDELNLTVDCFGWADVENRVPMTPDTVFAVFSMTKTVTGCALMCAIDRGLLSMDDPVEKYVPEFRDVSWLDVGARCIEVASGMKFEDFVRTNIFNPLGMTSTGFNLTPDMERRLAKPCPAEGGLFSTPRDFIRFSQMLAHHGLYRGTWVVSRETFDRIWAVKQTAPGVKEPYSVGAWLYGDWMGHEGAMRTDQRANLRTGHSRLFFIQTENKAGKAFFDAKAAWHKAADAVQGTPATVFGN